jgi:hypothetical protein
VILVSVDGRFRVMAEAAVAAFDAFLELVAG